jgi:hypothetical protein
MSGIQRPLDDFGARKPRDPRSGAGASSRSTRSRVEVVTKRLNPSKAFGLLNPTFTRIPRELTMGAAWTTARP